MLCADGRRCLWLIVQVVSMLKMSDWEQFLNLLESIGFLLAPTFLTLLNQGIYINRLNSASDQNLNRVTFYVIMNSKIIQNTYKSSVFQRTVQSNS